MRRNDKKMSIKLGMEPGAVVYVGRERTEPVTIDVVDYSETEYSAKANISVEEACKYRTSPTITWINVKGIHNSSIVEKLGERFDIHALTLEDIVNTGQRPKLQDTEGYIFVSLKMLLGFDEIGDITSEQVSVLFGERWVMTFQETGDDVLEPVRKRIVKTVPRVRFMSSDYLAYALIDTVVDHYFVLLENIGNQIDALDDAVSESPIPDHLDAIRRLKRQVTFMRKAVWPVREVIGGLERLETRLVKHSTLPYLRDLYEHIIQVIDTVDTYKEMISGLLDLYHTGISNRMNEVMKVLTIFASIFIPLGFLAGVYGMNFDTSVSPFNLPELRFKYGYIMFWCTAVLIGGGLFWFFRRKKWL